MDKLWTGISWVARVFAWIGGAMIMVAALVVSTEVICRKLFALPLLRLRRDRRLSVRDRHELVDGVRAGDARPRPHRCALRGFSPKVRAVFDLVALAGLAVLVIALTDRSWELVSDNLSGWNRSNTPLRVPLPYPQLPWFFGFVLFLAGLDDRLLARGDGVCAR